MSGNKKKDRNDYRKILETEESIEEKVDYPEDINDTNIQSKTHSNDSYVKSLKEKIEQSEDVKKSTALRPGKPVTHKFKAYQADESDSGEAEGSADPEEPAKPGISKKKKKALFPFSDKTTQKLEEEIKKSSSRDSDPPHATFRSEKTSWHGNSVYVLCGPDAGKSFYVTGVKVKIGRGLDNDVVLKDISVSRRHCLFIRKDKKWFAQDLGSDNGTYVDGKHVTEAEIKPGQYVQIGSTIIVIETS